MKKTKSKRKKTAMEKIKEENLFLLRSVRETVIRMHIRGEIDEDRTQKITQLLDEVKKGMET